MTADPAPHPADDADRWHTLAANLRIRAVAYRTDARTGGAVAARHLIAVADVLDRLADSTVPEDRR